MFALDLCAAVKLLINFFRETFLALKLLLDESKLFAILVAELEFTIGSVFTFDFGAIFALLVSHELYGCYKDLYNR
jgi:hypothetical protein